MAERTFPGFRRPTYTMVPDEVFDELMADLTGAELKVLLYIIRRTFGFKKDHDAISFKQFLRGITTHDGRQLDRGCGVSDRGTLSKSLQRLEEMGAILSQKVKDERGENQTTIYWLNVITAVEEYPQRVVGKPDQGVVGKANHPGWEIPRGVVGKSNPQERVEQETALQDESNSKTSNDASPVDISGEDAPGEPRRLPTYSALISQVTRDYSRLFHDSDHERSNRSRALRLWAESDLTEPVFVGLLHEARRIAPARGDILKDATDGSPAGTKNRMPYFFSVVEDLMSMVVEEKHG